MVNHMELIESERSINSTGQGILKRIFHRSEELLNFVFFVVGIIFPLVTYCVVIADQSTGPVLQYISEDKWRNTEFIYCRARFFYQ